MRLVLIAIVLTVSACAEPIPDAPVPVDVADSPTTSAVLPIEVAFRCGRTDLGEDPDQVSGFPPFSGDLASMMQEEAREEFEASREWWDSLAWRIVSETESTLLLLGVDEEEGRYGDVAFEMVDGEWRTTGWGECRIEPVVEGYGTATFELDPANPPDSTARRITVLATERNCANGEPPEGREVRTSVTETADRVYLLVLVEPISGDATCPSNPPFPVMVSLTGPLGDRIIVDNSTSPETEKEWPLPVRSSELNVWLAGDIPAEGTTNVFSWSGPNAGALLIRAANWTEEPTWFQSFPSDELTITGFVAACDGCEDECEAEGCDQLTRLGSECSTDYVATEGFDTMMTIRYSGIECTIELATKPIEP
jgi:hypothetical protein